MKHELRPVKGFLILVIASGQLLACGGEDDSAAGADGGTAPVGEDGGRSDGDGDAPAPPAALPACADLLTLRPLMGNPAVASATATPMTTAAPASRAYCMVNVTWRDPKEVGMAAGYAAGGPPTVDAFQTVRLGIALPLNTNTGDAAWGGRLIMTAGGGAQGSVPNLNNAINMAPAAIGGGSDSGHGDENSGSGDSWGFIQGERLNSGKVADWAGGRSNGITVKLAKQLAQVYYGQAPRRTYWNACSGGGHMGWAQVQFYPEEYDGALIGAPAHNWQEFRLADGWDELVRKKVAQKTTAITQEQLDAANAAANTACAAVDGATVNGLAIMNDPRACTWSAANHVCGKPGAPAAPLCLDAIQAAGIDQSWDGPRNRFGRRIWVSYDRGVNVGSNTALSAMGSSTAQVMRWNHFDGMFPTTNLYLDRESIDLAAASGADVSNAVTYEDEATLGSVRTADAVDDNDPVRLDVARTRGIKLIVYHGTQDPLIQFRNDIDFYVRVAAHFGNGIADLGQLAPWYRLFLVPNAAHCPSVPNALPALMNWVENGVAPDSLVQPAVEQGMGGALPPGLGLPPGFGGPMTMIPLLCPFPQKAIYMTGATDDAKSYACGGDLQTRRVICDGLRTAYKHENEDRLQTDGSIDPAMCEITQGPPSPPGP